MSWAPYLQITFTATAALAAIAVSTHDQHVHKVSRAWGVPWLSWLILAALLCPAVRVGDRAVDAVVKGLEFTATRLHLENVHYTLIGLSDALKYAPNPSLPLPWQHSLCLYNADINGSSRELLELFSGPSA